MPFSRREIRLTSEYRASIICAGMMLRWAGVCLSAGTLAFGQGATSQRALVNQYCAGCHNDKLKSGGFSWAKLDLGHLDQNADQAEKVIRKVRVGLMPPPGMPRPDPATTKAFATALETSIDQAAALHPNPGRPPLHRLNRTEYT